jgi:hypothetical protein
MFQPACRGDRAGVRNRVEALDEVEVRLGLADEPTDVDLRWVLGEPHPAAAAATLSTQGIAVCTASTVHLK